MGSSYAQFIIVLIIFAGVLAVTLWVTKWMAGYQRGKGTDANIQLIDSQAIATGKYIQIVRLGDRYFALAVSKDNVTLISELEKDSLVIREGGSQTASFKDILSGIRPAAGGDTRENENE
ncbi:MAG: flagellar biosynthetic protein FliO [Lachnospiraceae bacterium]|nr:flagellar biosynthetic protein FliO [Lachnospiraceae bacterium]MCR4595393.1 flagellar biosynthetic protein FliO [Lachnospiraceae bacterium]